MDLRQIRQFTVLAEELNFRRAAQRLHISQPPLSAAIRRLEEDLSVQLFERNRHTVTLTPAGEVFLDQARRILSQVQHAETLTKNAAQGAVGVLRISCVPSALLALLPVTLRRFHDTYPQVQVVVSEALSAKQLEQVHQGNVDIAVMIPDVSREDPRLRTVPLKNERFVLACPADHPLARRSSVRMDEIDAELLVYLRSPTKSPGFSGALMKAFEASRVQPTVIYNQDQWDIGLVMVAGGFGMGIVPRPMQTFKLQGVAYVELTDGKGDPITYPIAAVVPANSRDRIVENFMSLLVEVAATDPDR